MVGGEIISGYIPDVGIQERLREHGNVPIWKLRFYFVQFNHFPFLCLIHAIIYLRLNKQFSF